jgi:hypothetical protein
MPELDGKEYEYTDEGIEQYEEDKERLGKATGGGTNIKSIISNLLPSLYGKNTKVEKKGALDFGYDPSFLYQPRAQQQEGGEINDQMADIMPEEEALPIEAIEEEPIETMLPDEEMEDDYTDFIIGESLTPEDEEYLLNALEQDDRLSMIFDQVVDTASEFSGSGPIEGPGTERSDSIPARLSDGEFVVTSKAANQIGPENLQGLMEVAEMEADDEERQIKQAGGIVSEEEEAEEQTQKIPSVVVENENPLVKEAQMKQKNREAMRSLDPRLSLFAS